MAKVSKFDSAVLEVMYGSNLVLDFKTNNTPGFFANDGDRKITRVKLTFSGPVAKFPSVSNTKQLSTPRGALINAAKGASSPLGQAILVDKLKTFRPRSFTNIGYQAHLTAMTKMFEVRVTDAYRYFPESLPAAFNLGDDKHNRLFVLIFLADTCSRQDSHNIPKGICDWLQGVGLIKNDRNVDALALHQKNSPYKPGTPHDSIIIITPMQSLTEELKTFLERV